MMKSVWLTILAAGAVVLPVAAQDVPQNRGFKPHPRIRVTWSLEKDSILSIRAEVEELPAETMLIFVLDREVHAADILNIEKKHPKLSQARENRTESLGVSVRNKSCTARFTIKDPGKFRVEILYKPGLQPSHVMTYCERKGIKKFKVIRRFTIGTAEQLFARTTEMSLAIKAWEDEIRELLDVIDDPEFDLVAKQEKGAALRKRIHRADFERSVLPCSTAVLNSLASSLYTTLKMSPTASRKSPEPGAAPSGRAWHMDVKARVERIKFIRGTLEKVRWITAREITLMLVERIRDRLTDYQMKKDPTLREAIVQDITSVSDAHEQYLLRDDDYSMAYRETAEGPRSLKSVFERLKAFFDDTESGFPEGLMEELKRILTTLRNDR